MADYIQTEFTDTEGVAYKVVISDDTYTGDVIEVQGRATLEYPQIETMDMLRGSSLNIELESSDTDTYIDRIVNTVGDKKLPVKLYRDLELKWSGFVKPDGIIESYVYDYWVINIQAIDGLGLLENTSFLKSNGNSYIGSYSELELLSRCLELTGQTINFRIYDFNLYFSIDSSPAVESDVAILSSYINTDRFIKDDKEKKNVFTAKQVLESILKKYGAFVCQQDSKWHIIRLIDYYNNNDIGYKEYNLEPTLIDTVSSVSRSVDLGSQIDGYYPHHANANQQKHYNAALGAYKVFYKYGEVESMFENPKIYFNDNLGDIDSWIISSTSDFNFTLLNNPVGFYEGGIKSQHKDVLFVSALTYDYTTDPSPVVAGEVLFIGLKLSHVIDIKGLDGVAFYRQYIRLSLVTDSTTYYLDENGNWGGSSSFVSVYFFKELTNNVVQTNVDSVFDMQTLEVPEDGNIKIEFLKPFYGNSTLNTGSYTVVKSAVVGAIGVGVEGESHTAKRIDGNATAIIDTSDDIYSGDNPDYIGGVNDINNEATLFWYKKINGVIDETKQYPVLNWLVRDRLTISSGNSTIFTGTIYGYVPYTGKFSINNIEGVFMMIKYTYDLLNNTTDCEFERVFTDDVSDSIEYDYALEGENVVRPAIE